MPQPQLTKAQALEIDRYIRQEVAYIKCHKDDRADIVGEAWVRILKHIHKFDETRASLKTFVHQHTRGASLDYFRANYTPRLKDVAASRQQFNDTLLMEITKREDAPGMAFINSIALNTLLSDLIGRDRTIIELYLMGNTMAEIADKLDVTESRISQIISNIIEGVSADASK